MTTPIKTQCPHCQACFKVQQTQLNKVNATVSCDQCQRSFLVNQHLIVTSDAADTPKEHSSKDFPDDTLIHDGLIYDDMDIDESEQTALEYDSLEDMDAWLTQASVSTAAHNKPSKSTSNTSKKAATSLAKPAPKAAAEHSSAAQIALSSAAANDIRANVDEGTDNAWLENLLKEQHTEQNTAQDDTNLSQLLHDMGVPLKDEGHASENRIKQANANFNSTPEQRSIASLLWTLGCLVLALLLFAQYVIFNLETLVKNPAHAERLQTICSVAACSLPNADLSAFTITDPKHQSSQVTKDGQFSDISAALNNQSATAQLYPNIKVSVYSTDDLIGEFIAAPEDYLLSKQTQLAANSRRKVLFTIPLANAKIREVTISALY